MDDQVKPTMSIADECKKAIDSKDESKMITRKDQDYVKRQCDGTHTSPKRDLV